MTTLKRYFKATLNIFFINKKCDDDIIFNFMIVFVYKKKLLLSCKNCFKFKVLLNFLEII